jgi:hypothetical protein
MIKKAVQFFAPLPEESDLKEDKKYRKRLQWLFVLCASLWKIKNKTTY